MKYGQALYERSVPQWAPYNIDYNELKSLIRTHTTPPPGSSHSNSSQPVAIPGQTDEALSCFEARFARELGAQHARVDLFVRSKADEFHRRLSKCFLFSLGVRRRHGLLGSGIPRVQVDSGTERADKGLETGNWRLGSWMRLTVWNSCTDDIRNLDRFIQAQRIGFQKILKKYRKWTGSPTLPRL
ncbi:hypothetical protein V499_08755, partial [Pseudogymnoascus sp. VKM F-103]